MRQAASKRQASGPDFALESACAKPVCGVDEAGRGPWAGPVCAAAVILNPEDIPPGVDDSKRLTPGSRRALEAAIKASARAWSVAFASPEEIDALNILAATGLVMRRAVDALRPAPASVLVDGDKPFQFGRPTTAVVGGDRLSFSIAAASILAKTARDRLMEAYDLQYPGYGFARHKGYGVSEHRDALDRLGPCPIHRRSFAPVRRALAAGPFGVGATGDAS